MWCFQSVFQLPVLSFQLLFWHFLTTAHTVSQFGLYLCLSLLASLWHFLQDWSKHCFILAVKLLCWLGSAAITSASGLLKGKGDFLSLWSSRCSQTGLPNQSSHNGEETTLWLTQSHLSHFLVIWLQRAPSAGAPRISSGRWPQGPMTPSWTPIPSEASVDCVRFGLQGSLRDGVWLPIPTEEYSRVLAGPHGHLSPTR